MKFPRRRSRKRQQSRPHEARKMLLQQCIIGAVLVVVLCLIVTAVWYGSRVERWQITSVEVVGGKTISHELVEDKVFAAMEGAYYRLVPKTFTVTYPEETIVAAIASIPRVKEVRVERVDAATLGVAFTEYEPFGLWCEATDEACVFLDHTGYAFAAAPQLSGTALVRYYMPDSNVTVKTSPFPRSLFSTSKHLSTLLQDELDLYVTKIMVYDDIDISYFLTSGAELKVSNRLSAEESLTNLITIFSNEEFEHLAQGEFHYIDLRFGDKVFVSESEVIASSTATSSATSSDITTDIEE